MTLPSIFPPASLPTFLAAGHGLQETSVYAQVPRARGHGRVRARFTSPPRTVDVAWLLGEAQMADCDAWFENTLKVGERHFTAKVANQGPGQLYWDAVWLEPYLSEPINAAGGIVWRVTGRILLSGTGEATRPDDNSLSGEAVIALIASAVIVLDVELSGEALIALLPSTPLTGEAVIALGYLVDSFRLREVGGFRLREGGGKRLRDSDA